MKRLMVVAVLAMAPVGCVANQGDAPVRFLNTRALEANDGCTAAADRFITRGSLDLAGYGNYLIAPSVETNTVNQPIVIDGKTVTNTGLGDIILTELVYSYQASRPGVRLPADEEDRVPIYAVFRPETDPDESYLFMYTFGAKALAALQEQVQAGDESVTVLSTIYAEGYTSSGQKVKSNKFTFPVTVFATTLPACADDEVYSGTCGIPGMDGPITCVNPGS
ncbi:hypothetical protein JQX13_27335 [Archangium violaceum]|uniref:hypothetical protein n=1 Tax=Archangium violaceum TaxID=83451 RepID=UPI00193B8B2E|nr:hypothetical protein [Archangium violaceum]QRK03997.1 hypothetical protein JQX13_27335 [Archangium violaceum]